MNSEPADSSLTGQGPEALAVEDEQELARALEYEFGRGQLLRTALTHRSRINEQNGNAGDEQKSGDEEHNERLEFLGDAVLALAVGDFLLQRLPGAREGELSKVRALTVNEASLAAVARQLELGRYLRLGRGEEQTGGRDKTSILADALEAVIGAIYLDGGFAAAAKVVRALLGPTLEAAAAGQLQRDYKTRLQEWVQARVREVPVYQVVGQFGPDHAKVFLVGVWIGGREIAQAEGSTKKEAQQRAAEQALALLEQDERASSR